MARRQHLFLTVLLGLALFFSISYLFSPGPANPVLDTERVPLKGEPGSDKGFIVDLDAIPAGLLDGESIAPKLENATLK